MENSVTNQIVNFLTDLESQRGRLPKFAHNLVSTNPEKVYYSGPYMGKEELAAAIETLLFGKWSSAGEVCARFERTFSDVTRTKASFFCNSGSSANLLLIAAAKEYYGWKDNDLVLISTVGFPTTTSSVVQNRLTPRFVDIEMNSLNWNMEQVEKALRQEPIKAIFVSPVLGNPPDMDRLTRVCQETGTVLLLDNCDSILSSWNGHYLNEYAAISSCSLYVAHEITTLEGGMVSSDDPRLIDLARSYGTWGRACECVGTANLLPKGCCGKRFSCWLPAIPDTVIDHRYVFDRMGWNLKGIDMLAAIGIEQIKRLPFICQSRRDNQHVIQDLFTTHIKGVKGPAILDGASWVPFGTPIICESGFLKHSLVAHLEANGVQTRNAFAGNLLIHKGYQHLGDWRDYPEANKVLDRVFFVGCAPTISPENIAHIESTLKSFVPPPCTSTS